MRPPLSSEAQAIYDGLTRLWADAWAKVKPLLTLLLFVYLLYVAVRVAMDPWPTLVAVLWLVGAVVAFYVLLGVVLAFGVILLGFGYVLLGLEYVTRPLTRAVTKLTASSDGLPWARRVGRCVGRLVRR